MNVDPGCRRGKRGKEAGVTLHSRVRNYGCGGQVRVLQGIRFAKVDALVFRTEKRTWTTTTYVLYCTILPPHLQDSHNHNIT